MAVMRPTKYQKIGYRAVGDVKWLPIRGAWITPEDALLEEQLGRASTSLSTAGPKEILQAKAR
jgi:hypothetical protein